jgi:hypothetical protein
MFKFDPISLKVLWAVSVEEAVDTSIIDMSQGDISLDLGDANNDGVVDQGNVING